MGKYILGYSRFINESNNSISKTTDLIMAAAGKYIDIADYSEDSYTSAEMLSALTDELALKIKSAKGEAAEAAFTEEAMNASINFISEESCPACDELMEPCEACKQPA
jgi:hypothetical protein